MGVKATGIWQLALNARTAGLMGQALACTAKGLEPAGKIEMPVMLNGAPVLVNVNVCGELGKSPPDGLTSVDDDEPKVYVPELIGLSANPACVANAWTFTPLVKVMTSGLADE